MRQITLVGVLNRPLLLAAAVSAVTVGLAVRLVTSAASPPPSMAGPVVQPTAVPSPVVQQAPEPRPVPTVGLIIFPGLNASANSGKPGSSAAGPAFQPFWVQSFRPTQLWSNPGPGAVAFGPLPTWSYLHVLKPSDTSRFFALVAATANVAYVDRADVGPSGPPPPSVAGRSVTSVLVQPGDTLEGLSRRFGVSEGELIAANHLNPDGFILAGQVLIVPSVQG